MTAICEVLLLPSTEYRQAWDLQNTLAAEIARGVRPPTLLLLQHPHTFTFGRRGRLENLLWDEAECARRGVSLHWVDRGGDVTYHGPGQLVGYPLIPLAPPSAILTDGDSSRLPQADYVGYLRRLEEVLILTLASFGLPAERLDGLTGVWVRSTPAAPPTKIAAIGVKVDARGFTRHGFALNISTDPHYWAGIIGCGLKDHSVANLADFLSPPPSLLSVAQTLIPHFASLFGYEMVADREQNIFTWR